MTKEDRKSIYTIVSCIIITFGGIIISFNLNANRDDNKGVSKEIETLKQTKVDKAQYEKDQEQIQCEFQENKQLIQSQNELFLDIKENIGELNGKMDLVIKKQK